MADTDEIITFELGVSGQPGLNLPNLKLMIITFELGVSGQLKINSYQCEY